MTTEQYSIGYEAGYQDGFDAALAEPVKQEPVAYLNLQPVINWLENGCDPKEAAKELRIYQEQMKAVPVSAPKQEPVACDCGDIYSADSFGAGFIAGTGRCQNCDVAAPVSAKRECVDLTCQEVTALIMEGAAGGGWQGFAERVQDAFKEKNRE